jgi:cobalt-precorrin 5A hydrolase/precorrin-3B C17-methyltransferase
MTEPVSMTEIAIVVPTAAALPTARRLRAALPGAVIHGRAGRVEGADVPFAETTGHLRQLFRDGRTIVGLCASGILIRALAPELADKRREPPVLAVALDGSAVVPLLGGHRGANLLAARLGEALGVAAAITTAGDLGLGAALDAPPPGWRLANPQAAATVMADVLAGHPIGLSEEAGHARWLTASGLPIAAGATPVLRVTDKAVAEPGDAVVYHPPVLALGVGCARDCPPEEMMALALGTLDRAGLAPQAVACVVSLDLKADEPAVHALARHLDVPARFFPADRLEAERPRLRTPSGVVFAEVGCHGVAEGAALAAVGAAGALVVPKRKTAAATCAVARAPHDIDPAAVGRPRGRLTVVGIGPGAAAWRTPAVTAAVARASDLVGYALYLDLLGDLAAGKTRHQTALGAETDRARKALDLAAEGREVALVCSGDAGIYALATLVFELIDQIADPAWKTVEVVVEPGVSALQAAAARAGAPIGHDFCTISLSDLLTPREVILKRVEAAAAGDFVVGFYNPVSRRRREALAQARDLLLRHRPADTPVVVARNLGRPEEAVEVVALGDLTVAMADMLTLVLVGNSDSRRLAHGGRTRVYTPRGYAGKRLPKTKDTP